MLLKIVIVIVVVYFAILFIEKKNKENEIANAKTKIRGLNEYEKLKTDYIKDLTKTIDLLQYKNNYGNYTIYKTEIMGDYIEYGYSYTLQGRLEGYTLNKNQLMALKELLLDEAKDVVYRNGSNYECKFEFKDSYEKQGFFISVNWPTKTL